MGGVYEYYSAIKEMTIDWLWYPFIPYGKITLLQGDPGEGKSTVAVQIAALLSTGRNMPDGWKVDKPQNVIYQCAEDGIADTVKPRLIHAKADCDRMIHIVEDGDLTLADERIEEAIIETQARLVIIDPLQAYLGGDGDMQNAVRMRSLLRNLSKIAEKTKCAILIIGHMNKSYGSKNLYRGLGSIDIAAIARSALMIVRDNETPSIRYLFQIKNNLAACARPMGFKFGKRKGFQWIGTCDVDIDSMLTDTGSGKPSKRIEAMNIIRDMLRDGDKPSNDIYARIEKEGISRRTAESAKRGMDISAYKKNKAWYWRLEEEETSDGR